MARIWLLILALLAAPLASAGTPAPAEDVEAPAAPDVGAMAAQAGDAVAAGAAAVAGGAAKAGDALGAAAAAVGHALAAAGKAVAALVVGALQLLGHALAAAGRLLLALAAAVGHALASLASALGAALGAGAGWAKAHPKEAAVAAGSAGGLSLLAWLARRFGMLAFLPLYTRLAPSEMLDNRVRSAVFEHVRAHPGAHPSAIAQALGLGWGTVVYHLARLEETRLVVAKAGGHRKCYFVVGGDLDAAGREAVAAMSGDKPRLIVDALRQEPGLSQKDLADRLGMSQALASWHVKKLVASGVLVSTREGRSNVLRVADGVPATRAAPAPAVVAA